jgi:translation elongation factor EF-Tu-like GTPase
MFSLPLSTYASNNSHKKVFNDEKHSNISLLQYTDEQIKFQLQKTASTPNKRNFLISKINGVHHFHLNQIQSKTLISLLFVLISMEEGPVEQLKQQISLFHTISCQRLIIYLNRNKEEDDEEFSKLVEFQISELLKEQKIDINLVTFLKGNLSQESSVLQLTKYLNSGEIKYPMEEPFVLSVETFNIKHGGSLISAKCHQGHLGESDSVDIIGSPSYDFKSAVFGVTRIPKKDDYYFQFPVEFGDLKGYLVSSPGFAKKTKKIFGNIYFLDNNVKKVILNNEQIKLGFFSTKTSGTLKFKEKMILQGDITGFEINLNKVAPVYENMPFTVMFEENVIAYGRIVKFEAFSSWKERIFNKLDIYVFFFLFLAYMIFMKDIASSIWQEIKNKIFF